MCRREPTRQAGKGSRRGRRSQLAALVFPRATLSGSRCDHGISNRTTTALRRPKAAVAAESVGRSPEPAADLIRSVLARRIFGSTWLAPRLIRYSTQSGVMPPPNRELPVHGIFSSIDSLIDVFGFPDTSLPGTCRFINGLASHADQMLYEVLRHRRGRHQHHDVAQRAEDDSPFAGG